MSRPIQFGRMAPNRGLTIASGVANGINNALNNYAKVQMQRSQMQANAVKAQANAQFMQARAEELRRRNQDANMAKLQYGAAMLKAHGESNPEMAGLMKSALKPLVEQHIANMTPEEANAERIRVEANANKGVVDPAYASELNTFNPAEQKAMGYITGNQTKETVANTNAAARTDAARIYGDTRTGVADRTLEGTKYKADASSAFSPAKIEKANMDNLTRQMKQASDGIKSLDSPPPGSPPMDPDVKNHLKATYQGQLADLHSQYNESLGRAQKAGAQPAAAGAGPDGSELDGLMKQLNGGGGPKTMSVSDPGIKSAKPGTLITDTTGKQIGTVLDQMHSDGSYVVGPMAPQAPAQQPTGE